MTWNVPHLIETLKRQARGYGGATGAHIMRTALELEIVHLQSKTDDLSIQRRMEIDKEWKELDRQYPEPRHWYWRHTYN